MSKVFKAPLQVVDTIAEVGTDIVKAPIQITEDLYQGVRDVGDAAVNVVAPMVNVSPLLKESALLVPPSVYFTNNVGGSPAVVETA